MTNEYYNLIRDKLNSHFATSPSAANKEQIYKATCLVIRDLLLTKKQKNNQTIQKKQLKRVYYICMEFLLGRSLRNNLYNMGIAQEVSDALREMGFELEEIYELESDPGLGNGGLGRLAACFMDSLATSNYPAMGFSIRYDYGLFKQKIVDNMQVELPDLWLDSGEVWMLPRSDKNFRITLGGSVVESQKNGKLYFEYKDADVIEAIPYDVMISGADSKGVGVLRLWKASAYNRFDMTKFSQGDYFTALRANNQADLISKVLYPSDNHNEGKQLRLSQQYFLVSASLQSIIKDHLNRYTDLDNFEQKVAIHINDTHPALAIPELMRLFMDEHGYGWDDAWRKTVGTIAYTNHTVLSEALEKWDMDLVQRLLPRVYMIIDEINRRFLLQKRSEGKSEEKISKMAILWDRQIRMANLAVIGSHAVNGVSALHSDIIAKSLFKDFYDDTPDKFLNVTNGIAHRRWLCQSNPRLTDFIDGLIGKEYHSDGAQLKKLKRFYDDAAALDELGKIKFQNKEEFADFIFAGQGEIINPHSRFDVQIKRLHEYKRQLMNALRIIYYYLELKDNPNAEFTPQTFIFGAKAAGGYDHAKRVIMLLNCLQKEINADKSVSDKLKVLFVENYNVTKAERLIPASEVSEQISLAGKEASGTSNMKFMLNGAVTLGTIDGANVEIMEKVGQGNIFTFGLKADEVDRVWAQGYVASALYSSSATIRRVVDRLKKGFAGESFADLAAYLTIGQGGIADPFMCLMDFGDYIDASERLDRAYKNSRIWNRMALVNISLAGDFAADRSIDEYARKIWDLKRVH